jgi:hypothetical protein
MRRSWFSLKSPVEGTVNSMEKKTRVFGQTDVQEFHLRKALSMRIMQNADPVSETLPLPINKKNLNWAS